MSIASAPERLPQVELHFRGMPGVPEAQLMAEILDGAPDVHIEGPHGAVCVDGPIDEDLLLIAGGSGIAQCRAIVTHLRHAGQKRDDT